MDVPLQHTVLGEIINNKESRNVHSLSDNLKIDFNEAFAICQQLGSRSLINFIDATSKSGEAALLSPRPEGIIFYNNNGFIKEFEKEVEEKELKIVEDANKWYTTENARRIYEGYDGDQQRIGEAERIAKKAMFYTKIAAIATVGATILSIIIWLTTKHG